VRQGAESDASNTISPTTTTCAPVLINPADGSILENRRPTFEWQAVPQATSYLLQVSTAPDFSTLALNQTISATNYSVTTDLLINKVYYWRVRGSGPFGNGDWSVLRSFTTANPPSLPGISSPANGGLTTNYTPTLNWTESKLPVGTQLDHYQVQFATDGAFSNILYDQSTAASEFILPNDLNPNTRYYWRVRAFNTLAQYSSWTPAWSFRTAVLPPQLSSPVDGFSFPNLRPSFDWNDVSGATRYTLQISTAANFSYVLRSRSASVSNYAFISDLPRNTLLYWRVRTEAVNGPSAWSATRSFTTGNPPNIPSLLAPAVNALSTTYQPLLDWSDVTAPSGTSLDHYQVQIAIDSAFTSITLDENVVPSQMIPAPPLNPNVKYYWRVRSLSSVGHFSAWSAVGYFRAAMLAPLLSAPGDNAVLNSVRPAFNWQAVTGASSYTIQVSRYSNFSSNLVNANTSALTYTPVINLPRGITLYWRVRANGPNGPSLWSPVFQFTIQ
jgi:hypothetical protein